MGCSISCGAVAPGAICHASIVHSRRSTTTSGRGVRRASGNTCIVGCVNWCATGPDECRRRVPPSSTASHLRPSRADRVAWMGRRRSGAASAVSWWIRWGCCSRWSSFRPIYMTAWGPSCCWTRLARRSPRLARIWADQGYAGALRQWVADRLGIELESSIPGGAGSSAICPISWTTGAFNQAFTSCRYRWVVERTQPHYLQDALDVQERTAQHGADRAA